MKGETKITLKAARVNAKLTQIEATYVLTSQVRGVSAVFHHNFHNTTTLNRFLKAHGYKLRSKEMLWKNIPVGTYYVGPNYSKPILKRNDRYLA